MKKWVIPLLAAILLLQGCTNQDADAKEVTDTVIVEEEHSEGESRSTILEEKLEKEAMRLEEETAQPEEIGEDVVNIGSHLEPDIEKIIAAKPDLVIASANTDADMDMEKILTNAGITVAYFSVSNFNEYMNMLSICTDITGRKDLFEKNGTEVQRLVEAARERVNQRNLEGKKAPRIVFFRASASSIKAKGSYGNVGGEMLCELGCINIADEDDSLLDDLSMEAVITADPDFIFVTTQGKDTKAVQQNIMDTLLSNPAWNRLSAVKNGQYYVLEKELYNLKLQGWR